MIQLGRLEGFHWVAKTGGYARAARAFPYPITQPAVHQQVRKLEEDIGLSLFERVGKDRMKLTPAGERLHEFVGPFFDALPSVLRAVKSGEHGGQLHVHAEALMLRRLLPEWIQRFTARAPNAQVDLRELPRADVAPLIAGEADLCVGYFPELPTSVASQVVGKLDGYIVAPLARASRGPITLRALRDETFIAYNEDQVAHDLQIEALRQNEVQPAKVLFASTTDAILGFIESGLGYSLLPALRGQEHFSDAVIAKPLRRPKVEFDVLAAWRKDTPEHYLLDVALETAPRP